MSRRPRVRSRNQESCNQGLLLTRDQACRLGTGRPSRVSIPSTDARLLAALSAIACPTRLGAASSVAAMTRIRNPEKRTLEPGGMGTREVRLRCQGACNWRTRKWVVVDLP